MSYAQIHRNWDRDAAFITEGFSIEITAKDVDSLHKIAPQLPKQTPIAVTFLPSESIDARVSAARTIRELGFEPMPHFSARRIKSERELQYTLERMINEADVKRCFTVAGDPSKPEGPYSDSLQLIESGLFESSGIQAIGVAGHPNGHPKMSTSECMLVLKNKCSVIHDRGMKPLIVTQFGFDPSPLLLWLKSLRDHNVDAPVRIGVPGPSSIKTLIKFSARCGVSASASILSKYGISITKLLGNAGPDKMVDALSKGFTSEHGRVRLHFYPFGGLVKTVAWIENHTNNIR